MKYTVAAGFAFLAILAWLFPPQNNEKQQADAVVPQQAGVYQTSCAACHGDRGQGNDMLGAPSIASLPRWYAKKQLENFRAGFRGNHPDDTTGQQMRGAILNLTRDKIDEALDTLEAFPVVTHEPTIQGDLKRGAELYRENCMECHRFNGRGELAFGSSHLAGLQDWYLMAQWGKYKSGTRGYHPDDEGGAKMRKAVEYLVNEKDTKNVIAYIATLAQKYPEGKKSRSQTPNTNIPPR